MVNSLTPPGLEGLFDLDRQGVDIRPTLLRVLTDQYLRSPAHTREEEQRYTELAMRLLDETDVATRAAVSARLAPHAFAPRKIILQLARDVIEVAEPVLLKSPVLTLADCETIGAERGLNYAAMLAKRAPTTALAKETAPPPAREVSGFAAAECSTRSSARVHASELCELFFAADAAERKLILLNLDYSPWPAEPVPAPLQRADIWRVETSALLHNRSSLVRELERALGISSQQAHRLIEDDLGEPIVAAAKAMGLPADVLQRILLFMNPSVGHSVDRVYELATLYNDISVEAARRLIAIMRAANSAERQMPPDTRAVHAMLENARGTSSQTGRAATTRSDALTPQWPAARG